MAAAKYRCFACLKNVAATGQSPSPLRYRKHDKQSGEECPHSRTLIPAWIIKRGPETEDDDRPVIGRDYAVCPACGRSPLLDGEGMYARHHVTPNVPAAEQMVCPKSGQPYTPEEEVCRTGTAAGPSPATTTPPALAATGQEPTQDAAPALPEPNESEEMLSKWAATAREIEDRKLPPCQESTTTPPDSPPPGSEPVSVSKQTNAPTDGSPEPAPSTAATEAPTSPTQSNGTGKPEPTPCHITAPHPPHQWMHRRTATQCPGKPAPTAASTAPAPAPPPAEDAAAASEAAPSSTKSSKPTPPDIEALATAFPKRPPVSGARTSAPAAEPSTAATPPTPATAPPSSSPFSQPGSPFSQPGAVEPAPAAVPMTVMAEQLVARMREVFYSYGNRKTDDNRSAQATLGPSEIGSPCDRRLAMSLLRIPPVNPGGDQWASFKGTAIHAALADVFTWASGNTGRFAVEVPLRFPSELVPHGTSDLLDRVLFMLDDHKIQGHWSQNKLRTEGMTPTQRVQVHMYGFGQRIKGERVDFVAILSWPMESSSLDDMYAVVEPYDPQIARDALARVDRIAGRIQEIQAPAAVAGIQGPSFLQQAAQFTVDPSDCKFCDWYAPGDPGMTRGCPGRA